MTNVVCKETAKSGRSDTAMESRKWAAVGQFLCGNQESPQDSAVPLPAHKQEKGEHMPTHVHGNLVSSSQKPKNPTHPSADE